MSDSLGLPIGVARILEAHLLLLEFFQQHGLEPDPSSRTFYTAYEWAARGEDFCKNAVLVVVYDGGNLKAALNLDRAMECEPPYELHTLLTEKLASAGFYMEEGTHWYCGIYDRKAGQES